jgi:hypothetical protein
MDKKTLYGDIFIVPNSLQVCDFYKFDDYGYDVENVSGLQVCFEGWIINDECKNWSRYCYKEFESSHICDRFPVKLFMGKHEGDTVEVTIRGRKVVLFCLQTPHRYGERKFEEVLYDLTQSFGGICAPCYYKPPLCENSQYAILLANHEKYSRSMGFQIKEPTCFRYLTDYTEKCNSEAIKKSYISDIEQLVADNRTNNINVVTIVLVL